MRDRSLYSCSQRSMRVILVHGFNASPEMNFHPWLARELRAKGFNVIAPTLPLKSDGELNIPDIMESLRRQVGILKADDILLGHSLGALVILQYMQAVEMTETPRVVILVAAPWKVGRPELQRLFMADLDADVAMWKAREFVVVHSADDKLVPLDHARKLAESLKARLVVTDHDDHFMGHEHPVLLLTIEQISQTPFVFAPGMSLPNDYESLALAARLPVESERPSWMT